MNRDIIDSLKDILEALKETQEITTGEEPVANLSAIIYCLKQVIEEIE